MNDTAYAPAEPIDIPDLLSRVTTRLSTGNADDAKLLQELLRLIREYVRASNLIQQIARRRSVH
jgi:hypothetical protein